MNVGVTVTIAMIAMVQLWGAGAFSRAKFTHFKRGLKSRSHATNCDDNELFYEGFEGPKASLGDMVAGIENNELGINVVVGPSTTAGLGLFVSVSDGVDEAKLTAGTPIVGYSKGTFGANANGDKTVSFVIENSRQAVFFEKTLMPVYEAVSIIANRAEGAKDLTNMILGHTLSLDPGTKEIVVEPEMTYKDRYFIPDVPLSNVFVDENGNEVVVEGEGEEELRDNNMYLGIGATNMGQYANDLAYTSRTNTDIDIDANTNTGGGALTALQMATQAAAYEKLSEQRNVLKLIWRMEEQELEVPVSVREEGEGEGEGYQVEKKKVLAPTWPVMILSKDVRFSNTEPIEIGLEYSYRYWLNYDKGLVQYNSNSSIEQEREIA